MALFNVSTSMAGLSLWSYNSTGFSLNKQDFIRDIMNTRSCDIIFLQETFLGEKKQSQINSLHTEYIGIGKNGFELHNDIQKGRNKAGIAILWHKTIGDCIKHISVENNRLMAASLKCASGSVLLINCYFPNDTHSNSEICPDLIDVCNDIERIVYSSKDTFIIIGGDINVDLSRNNAHTRFLKDFMSRHKLTSIWEYRGFPEYTFKGPFGTSCVDHFIVSQNVITITEDSCVYEGGLNFSVHNPIHLKLNIDMSKETIKETVVNSNLSNIAWHAITDEEKNDYKCRLDDLLSKIPLPMFHNCNDVFCCDDTHRNEINNYCQSLITSCVTAAEIFPKCKKRKKLPYWGSRVKGFKDDAIFWKNIWLECGKPPTGVVHDIMRKTKLQYHYAVRRLKRKSDELRKCKMAEALKNNSSRDFWTEVKRVENSGRNLPSNIGGKTSSSDIAALFAEKYKTLYNSVPSDNDLMSSVSQETRRRLANCSLEEMQITDTDIKIVLRNIKSNKSDDEGFLFSNHLLLASGKLHDHIAYLFNGMFVHGYTPECLLNSTIVSIPKDSRGNLSADDNYRGIALCSSLFKLFEGILIKKQDSKLTTSDMQYAYKRNHSTTMCTMVLKDVVNQYLLKNSSVYCCFIDASKAFDRIRHDLLFDMLLKRGVNPLMVRILIDSYERQTVQTSWLGEKSQKFLCTNGVRQGGILSPLLYSIYNDVLLNKLKENGQGCWLGNQYYGALSYADDLCILSPTIKGLENMLGICELYGKEYDVLFNPKKTKCMEFTRKVTNNSMASLTLCGNSLEWIQSFKYLGNWVTHNLSEDIEISKKVGSFYGSYNHMFSCFKHVGVNHLFKLFNSYCCHYYGSQAWRLRDKNISSIYTAWNKAVRHICGLPYRTHTYFLPFISETLYVKDQIYLRAANMIMCMLNSSNESVRMLALVNKDIKTSIIGGNLDNINEYLNVDISSKNVKYLLVNKLYETFTPECQVVLDLVGVTEGSMHLPGFNHDEISEMLNEICTL